MTVFPLLSELPKILIATLTGREKLVTNMVEIVTGLEETC